MAYRPRRKRRPPGDKRKRGTAHYAHKLTEEQVREIRADFRSTQRQLAAKYGVSCSRIHDIKHYYTYKYVR